MAAGLQLDLNQGDTIVIPQGSSATVTFIEKSGRRCRVRIVSDQPVTISRQGAVSAAPAETPATPSGVPPTPRRPTFP